MNIKTTAEKKLKIVRQYIFIHTKEYQSGRYMLLNELFNIQ